MEGKGHDFIYFYKKDAEWILSTPRENTVIRIKQYYWCKVPCRGHLELLRREDGSGIVLSNVGIVFHHKAENHELRHW